MSKSKNRGIRDIREFRQKRELNKGNRDNLFTSKYKSEDKQLIKHCDKIVITQQVESKRIREQEHIPYEKIKAFKDAFNAEFDIKPRFKVRKKIYWNQLLRISAVILLFVNITIVFFYGKGDRNGAQFSPYQVSSLDISGLAVNSDFRLEKGIDYYEQGKYLQAIDLLEEVSPTHAKAEMVMFLMANSFMALEDFQVAIVYFEQMLAKPGWDQYKDVTREYLTVAYSHLEKK